MFASFAGLHSIESLNTSKSLGKSMTLSSCMEGWSDLYSARSVFQYQDIVARLVFSLPIPHVLSTFIKDY